MVAVGFQARWSLVLSSLLQAAGARSGLQHRWIGSDAGREAAASLHLLTLARPGQTAGSVQEIVPLNASNVVMGASAEAAAAWDGLIDDALNREASCAPCCPAAGPQKEMGHSSV